MDHVYEATDHRNATTGTESFWKFVRPDDLLLHVLIHQGHAIVTVSRSNTPYQEVEKSFTSLAAVTVF